MGMGPDGRSVAMDSGQRSYLPGLFSKRVAEGSLSPTEAQTMVPLWKWRLKAQYKDLKAGPRNIISRVPKRNYGNLISTYILIGSYKETA